MDFFSLISAAVILALIFLFFLKREKHKSLPPGPHPWPLVGNLPFLVINASAPHRALAMVAQKHGALFTLHFGSYPVLVVSSPDMAKQLLKVHDANFTERPPMRMPDILLYGQHNSLLFSWRPDLRKLLMQDLFAPRKLQEHAAERLEEISHLVNGIRKWCAGHVNGSTEGQLREDTCFEVRGHLVAVSANVVGLVILSTRLWDWDTGSRSELFDILHESNGMALNMLIGDFIPRLSWLDAVTMLRMRRSHTRIDKFLTKVVADRIQELQKEQEDGNPREKLDVLDLMLSRIQSTNGSEGLDPVKSMLLELFAAGMDTTSVASEWALAELLNHPLEMKKLQEELDCRIGGQDRLVQESDLPDLPYLGAVVKEVLRLHPPAPFLLPHYSREACTIEGFHIPKGTRALVNVWAIGRDPGTWEQPNEFSPARFCETSAEVRGNHYSLLPFGSGRRICPGLPLALPQVSLTVANLVHNFNWTTARKLDMSEKQAGTVMLAVPLRAVPSARR